MKCVKKVDATGKTIMRRVKNIDAEIMVKEQGWSYAPKEEFRLWKKPVETKKPVEGEKK